MKILIVGGGVAGPTLAGFLKNTEHDITLIDQAPEWGDIGYAIALWGNDARVWFARPTFNNLMSSTDEAVLRVVTIAELPHPN